LQKQPKDIDDASATCMIELNGISIKMHETPDSADDVDVLSTANSDESNVEDAKALLTSLSIDSATGTDNFNASRAARKAAKKRAKADRRAKREGRLEHGQKDCNVCGKSVDLLVRCTIDESQQWNMVCGKCWIGVSGGVVDGDANHPHYRYGGLWKNRAKRN